MARQTTSAAAPRKRRGRNTFLWSAAVVIAVIAMIWTEQVALLYVLATLSVSALLIVVAFSDLGPARRGAGQSAPLDDSAAVGDAMNTAAASRPTVSARR